MAHVRLVTMMTPEQEKRFVNTVNNTYHVVEGELRRGYVQAHLAKVSLWDIRIKRRAQSEFLYAHQVSRMLVDTPQSQPVAGSPANKIHHFPRISIIRFFWRLVMFFTNHYVVTKHETDTHAPRKGWQYSFYLGSYKDPEKKKGVEEL